jgi:hypothetical protein
VTYDGGRAGEKRRPLQLRRREDGLHLNDETFPHFHDFSLEWLALHTSEGVEFGVTTRPDPSTKTEGAGWVTLQLENAAATYTVKIPWRNTAVALWEGTLTGEAYDNG